MAKKHLTGTAKPSSNTPWQDGYTHGTNDCAADYECGIRQSEREKETLKNSNELLRSMSSIVERKGVSVNWGAFEKNLNKELLRQHKIMYPQSYISPN